MVNKMNVDKKILEEVARFNSMNKYIMEQDAPVVPPPPADPAAGLPAETPAPEAASEKIDVATDPEVEKIDAGVEKTDSEGGTEELEITDLVDAQTKLGEKQDNYFDNLFSQLQNLESKLSEMDSIMAKLNSIENKIEKYRVKTPEEKLELRSYDSYPFNQKLSQFFDEKEEEMEKTGKRDYVLTPDDVTDINSSEIKDTFQPKPENVRNFGY
jgi:hypothetical protein